MLNNPLLRTSRLPLGLIGYPPLAARAFLGMTQLASETVDRLPRTLGAQM